MDVAQLFKSSPMYAALQRARGEDAALDTLRAEEADDVVPVQKVVSAEKMLETALDRGEVSRAGKLNIGEAGQKIEGKGKRHADESTPEPPKRKAATRGNPNKSPLANLQMASPEPRKLPPSLKEFIADPLSRTPPSSSRSSSLVGSPPAPPSRSSPRVITPAEEERLADEILDSGIVSPELASPRAPIPPPRTATPAPPVRSSSFAPHHAQMRQIHGSRTGGLVSSSGHPGKHKLIKSIVAKKTTRSKKSKKSSKPVKSKKSASRKGKTTKKLGISQAKKKLKKTKKTKKSKKTKKTKKTAVVRPVITYL